VVFILHLLSPPVSTAMPREQRSHDYYREKQRWSPTAD
jgi:hypothetical protein